MNMVAIKKPMNVRTTSLERKSSGVRLMLMKFRLIRIQVSGKKELANLGPRWWYDLVFGPISGVR